MPTNQIISRDEVLRVAKLANLSLTDKDALKFQSQLSSILDYVDHLKKVDTSGIDETSQVTGLENASQESSQPPETLAISEVFKNALGHKNNLFRVSAILKAK